MATDFSDVGVISENKGRRRRLPVGATAIRPGDLVKFSSNVLVPAADNDENLQLFVALEYSAASNTTTGCLVVPFGDVVANFAYTGGTPTVGTAYGISDQRTVDVANTTQLMVLVTNVDTTNTVVSVIEFQQSA